MADYGVLRGASCAGTLGDSSDYNIDGCCFVEDYENELGMSARANGEIISGKIVNVVGIEDGYKKIAAHFTDSGYDIAYGVALRDSFGGHVDPTGLTGYSSGEPISVVTHGRVWALTTTIQSAPTPFSHVYVTENGYAAADAGREDQKNHEIMGWTFTGGFDQFSQNFHLVEIQVKQSTGHMHHDNKIKVNGISLKKSSEGNLRHGTPVFIIAEVSPKTATDKTGSWHVDDDSKGTIEVTNEAMAKFTPASNFVGDVHITWVANDGSGVQGMVEITYIP
ncbi:scaffolding protein [Hafnia phage Pocis76]|uniref:Scaffolding protein n=1 Tax=Hafnia phage Pocis76 TaxID=2831174 RepID=A0A8E7KXR0_9CAUD|nr:scaffolding protein [Hafnia phage Pocis76]